MTIHNLGEAWEQPAVASFIKGCNGQLVETPEQADICVCWGLRPPYEDKVRELTDAGKPVFVLDSGYLGRPAYGRAPERKDYYALNMGGLLRPEPTAKALCFVLSHEHAAGRQSLHLGAYNRPFNARHAHQLVVVLGQTVGDRSHGVMSASELARIYAQQSHQHHLPVMFRAHPHGAEVAEALRTTAPDVIMLDEGMPLLTQLAALGGPERVLVYTISSNAGLEAKLSGYQVEAPQAWYGRLTQGEAFLVACDAQFTCDELEDLAGSLVGAMKSIPRI